MNNSRRASDLPEAIRIMKMNRNQDSYRVYQAIYEIPGLQVTEDLEAVRTVVTTAHWRYAYVAGVPAAL